MKKKILTKPRSLIIPWIKRFQNLLKKKERHREKSGDKDGIKLSSSQHEKQSINLVKKRKKQPTNQTKKKHFSVFNTVSEFIGRKLSRIRFHIQEKSTQRSNLQAE